MLSTRWGDGNECGGDVTQVQVILDVLGQTSPDDVVCVDVPRNGSRIELHVASTSVIRTGMCGHSELEEG